MAEILPRDTVRAAFRLILGREPESDATIEAHAAIGSEGALRAALLRSAEFTALYEQFDHTAFTGSEATGLPPVLPVETEAGLAERAALWDRVAKAWDTLGQDRPHWSVLTFDAFRPELLERHRAEFSESAALDTRLVEAALARFPGRSGEDMTCLEIGCGVGRATRALAGVFGRVAAVDVSAPHLAVAREELAAAGVENVDLHQVLHVEDFSRLPFVDFFYSRLVLQHNPPPLQVDILAAAFARLAPGGIALFQVLSHAEGYSYRVAEDLGTPEGGMEMHVLPQPAVFASLEAGGLRPVEVQSDPAAGMGAGLQAHLFLARKD